MRCFLHFMLYFISLLHMNSNWISCSLKHKLNLYIKPPNELTTGTLLLHRLLWPYMTDEQWNWSKVIPLRNKHDPILITSRVLIKIISSIRLSPVKPLKQARHWAEPVPSIGLALPTEGHFVICGSFLVMPVIDRCSWYWDRGRQRFHPERWRARLYILRDETPFHSFSAWNLT